MFSELTLRELDKLWKMMESAVYHMSDYYGTGNADLRREHCDVFWDIACEIDRRS